MLRKLRLIIVMVILAVVAIVTIGSDARAQMPLAERMAALERQFYALKNAQKRGVAVMAEQEIWRLWFIGVNVDGTERLAAASLMMREGRYGEAVVLLDELVADYPGFAEAWNQRAFAKFLMNNLTASLEDIEQTLTLEPRHFGALAGRARIEARLGSMDDASRTMGEVGVIHPWMARLSPIPADPPPPAPPEGEEL
ncbi:MAG: tetratricopeptide repeat protein [Pikeienuella sp.]